MEPFAVFKNFMDPAQAEATIQTLNKHEIEWELSDNSPAVDLTFTGNALQNQVQLKLRPEDFERARKVLEVEARDLIGQVDEEHYLYGFSDDELMNIVTEPDEWSAFDYELAQRILSDRGKSITPEEILALKEQRQKELAQPEEKQTDWIYVGYFFAIAGGLIGLMIGWYLWSFKKTLPNGQRIHAYHEVDRLHGRRMFFIGLIMFTAFTLYKVGQQL